MLAVASTALSARTMVQSRPICPTASKVERKEHQQALSEDGDRHRPQRPLELRQVVGGGDRAGQREHQRGDQRRGEQLDPQGRAEDDVRRLPIAAPLGDEAGRRLRDPEVGGQDDERADAEREGETPKDAGPSSRTR